MEQDRFGKTADAVDGDDVIAVGVQDTYVDSGIAVAQVSWSTMEEPDRRQTGLVEVTLAEGESLSRVMHRTLFVRQGEIQPADTRFDLDE